MSARALLSSLRAVVGDRHVLTGNMADGFVTDWTGYFRGHTGAVVRPRDTAEVAAVLTLCRDAGVPVVPQGGNTGLVGGSVPLAGELVLSMTRLDRLGPVDTDARQVTASAGVTLQRVSEAHENLELGVLIASRHSATVGGAVATNAGGLRVLRHGPMRAQIRGIEAVLSDGSVVSRLSGLVKDNTGYDYPGLLAGSEGTLAVITQVRLQLVDRIRESVVAIIGLASHADAHAFALLARRDIPGLLSAEFFTDFGLRLLVEHAGLAPLPGVVGSAYLLLDAAGPGALDDLATLIGDLPAVVARDTTDRRRLWSYRERHPDAAGYLGTALKFDVSVPAARWVELASSLRPAIAHADPDAIVVIFGHIADGNIHVNVVPAAPADGRHQDAVFTLAASLDGSISAEHGIGALKAPWLSLARSPTEQALFANIRAAFDPSGILNPNVLPIHRGSPPGSH